MAIGTSPDGARPPGSGSTTTPARRPNLLSALCSMGHSRHRALSRSTAKTAFPELRLTRPLSPGSRLSLSAWKVDEGGRTLKASFLPPSPRCRRRGPSCGWSGSSSASSSAPPSSSAQAAGFRGSGFRSLRKRSMALGPSFGFTARRSGGGPPTTALSSGSACRASCSARGLSGRV